MSEVPPGGPSTLSPPTDPATAHRPPDDWVPPDQRFLGLDKRTVGPAIALVVIWFVWAHVTPWIDRQIDLDNPVVAGDVVNLNAGELTFVPAVGWNLEEGTLLDEATADTVGIPSSATLTSEAVVYRAQAAAWDGTADELLDQMLDLDERLGRLVAADERSRVDITNADGVPGRLSYVTGNDESVILATFVFEQPDGAPQIGVEIEVVGTPEDMRGFAEEIAGMIDTTTDRATGAAS